MGELRELIDKLEKLEGPSREMDALIMCALAAPDGSKVEKSRFNDEWCIFEPRRYGKEPFGLWEWRDWHRPGGWPLTASLDAAIALCERVLPGWFWRVGRTSLFPNGWAYISRMHPDHCTERDEATCSDGKAATPAIALVLATLRALEAQESEG